MVCLVCTLIAVLPSGAHLLFRPSKKNFLLALLNSSLGFFLFSFQVHEKSILIATLPALLLFQLYPFECFWFLQISTFSMIPLLHKDGLLLPYLALSLLSLTLLKSSIQALNNFKPISSTFFGDIFNIGSFLQTIDGSKKSHHINRALVLGFYSSLMGQTLLLFAFVVMQPPMHLPFLWPLLISAYSCGHFVLFFIYFNYRQFFSYANEATHVKRASGKRKLK